MTHPSLIQIIQNLESHTPRLFQNQILAANYIKSIFDQYNLVYTVEEFSTKVPKALKAQLLVDGQEIPCKSCSLFSGQISLGCDIVDSSTTYSHADSNLNYNGKSDVISRAAHYEIPSLAFSRKDLSLVQNAKSIDGQIDVEAVDHTSQNIILGNTTNPTNLVFTHFDSVESGAMDNASGTAITILTILQNPELLQNNLFILSSDEELSLDSPVYWGKGYREFQKLHQNLIDSCQKIYIVDSFGLTPAKIHQEEIDEFFPINDIDNYIPKTFAISCNIPEQWSIYHSSDDTLDKLNPDYLNQGLELVQATLK